jgi:hypothetical protein
MISRISPARVRTRRRAVVTEASTTVEKGAQTRQRLLGTRAEIGHLLLRGTGQLALAPAEEDQRQHHDRHHQQHDAGQLGAGDQQQHQRAQHHHRTAQILRHRRAHQRLQHRDIGRHARQDVAGAGGLEERGRQADDVVEQLAPDIRRHPLTQPGHQRVARRGGQAEQRHHHEHDQRGAVQLGGAAGEALVDQMAHPLPQPQQQTGCETHRHPGAGHLQPVGAQIGQQQAQGGDGGLAGHGGPGESETRT